jgi:hypothetical protein
METIRNDRTMSPASLITYPNFPNIHSVHYVKKLVGFLQDSLLFYPEDGGRTFFRTTYNTRRSHVSEGMIVCRKNLGAERYEVKGWMKLQNEEFRNCLHFLSNIIRMIILRTSKRPWHVIRIREMRSALSLETLKHKSKWENNVKLDIR